MSLLQQKKKTRQKTTTQRGPTALPKNRGTGFEEYFADPPMTPAEAALEKTEIYAKNLTFEERIQSCIQRFRSRRRLHNYEAALFNEYLFLGGIDTSANAFGGYDTKDLQALSPAERRDATATDTVHAGSTADERFYSGDRDHWSVDFTGVLAGFFSTSLVKMTSGQRHLMETAAAVMENFLRYTLHHDVCPEYEEDIGRALQLCADAREEWLAMDQLRACLPGPFNMAATDLFGPLNHDGWACFQYPRPEGFDAKTIFYSACALLGENEALESARRHQGPTVTKEYSCTLELVKAHRPCTDMVERFRLLKVGDSQHDMAPLGKAFFKTATIEDGWDHPSIPAPVGEAGIWLYFEDVALASMRPGIKMTLAIVELDVGIRFVKSFTSLVPSFYTFLPQELMKHYKMPRDSERPAPSVEDPEVEEKHHVREAQEA